MLLPVQLLVFADGGTLLPPWRQNGFVGTQPTACTVLSKCTVHLHMGGGGPCKMNEAAREPGCALLGRIQALALLRSFLVSASAFSHLPPSKAEQAGSGGLRKSALGLEHAGKGKGTDP